MSTLISPTVCDGCGQKKPTEWPEYRGWASISKSCAQGDDDPIDDLCPTCLSRVEALFAGGKPKRYVLT
jgi:hypothetical protein